MSDLFSGLEGFGIKNLENLEVFEEEKKAEKKVEKKETVKVLTEEDFLFDKTYTCPVCEHEFKSKMVRTGKAKLLSADTDLRPKYQGVDSLKYDAVMCPNCGYAALNRYFSFVMSSQAKLIKEQISSSFKDPTNKDDKVYDYDTALARHKMALLNTVVKKGKASEKAYTCLKIAWLYRGKREKMRAEGEDRHKLEELYKEEMQFLKNAYEGFESAFSKEDFPMCGMDQNTLSYLLADLARRTGKKEEAKKWVAKVLVARNANKRIKEKALDLKELLQESE